MVDIKRCSKCGEEKPLAEFSKKAASKDGLRGQCKTCIKEYRAAYYAENRVEVKAKNAAYRVENQVEVRAREAAYRAENRVELNAKKAAYRQTDAGKASQRERDAKQRAKWPERRRARSAVSNALAAGKKKKPKHCCSCGSQHKGPIEAHHWKGYEEEFWLDVLWLCKPCHSVRG